MIQKRNRNSIRTWTIEGTEVAVPCERRARREEREAEEHGREMVGEGEERRRGTREGENRPSNLLLVNTWWPSLDTRLRSWSSLGERGQQKKEQKYRVVVDIIVEVEGTGRSSRRLTLPRNPMLKPGELHAPELSTAGGRSWRCGLSGGQDQTELTGGGRDLYRLVTLGLSHKGRFPQDGNSACFV